ncbi:MAG: glutamate-5-semialdehyde dehydrogenase [Candidatus Methylomirabilales bacterium]
MVEVPVKIYINNLTKKARAAARPLALLSTSVKNHALIEMAQRLAAGEETTLEANREDMEAVGKNLDREANKEAVERIRLTAESIKEMDERLRQIADLPDPVGENTKLWQRPNGMQVSRVRVPIGVVGVISEMGPKGMIESMALCLKSGNVCVFRGSPELVRTHTTIAKILCEAAEQAGVPAGAITFVERAEREAAVELMRQHQTLDAIIARGGPGLRKAITEQTRVPVLCHDGGISHMYIDVDADLPLAQNLVVNSKVQLASASNSVDTLLVHQSIPRTFLTGLVRRLLDEFKVEVHGCPKTISIAGAEQLSGYKAAKEASEEDWSQQFLGPIIAVKLVKDMDEALDHIARYGPSHTDAIVTREYASAMRFVREVDASAVMVNSSTRLHDGEQFGMGGQMGINTTRVHARGPVGLEELTCEKYTVLGSGQLCHPHPTPVTYEDALMLKHPR